MHGRGGGGRRVLATGHDEGMLEFIPSSSLAQLQEKFRLDLDDEECIHFFQDLINESVKALFPQIHRWAQY
ncbi:Phosphatidylinositol 3-kinase VPS34 [Camellia lanceoleosa]|uniref:Phosphatidylinositol 3-kinase VPS34 n=1 Tax=Camellia lanceoleosa TaxID=1840588 RepID=A0ACC0FWE3_9ERIC|nr:Phosphatidylinositol 3-kinase VPS34 [Camellia lanceoleosa]